MNCETVKEYLDRYGPLVADRARQAFEPCTFRRPIAWSRWT